MNVYKLHTLRGSIADIVGYGFGSGYGFGYGHGNITNHVEIL